MVKPLHIGGNLVVEQPLVLAPMAGITSAVVRLQAQRYGAQLCTSEMIIASTFLAEAPQSMHLARWHPEEDIRSAQLYGVQPSELRDASKKLVHEHGVQHIDLNFGCPVRKVTSRGGGSAIPLKLGLLRDLVAGAVSGADNVPVTVKMRMGVSPSLESHEAGALVAQDAGACALTLHARYADQLYATPVHHDAITKLVDLLHIPVIGNGDIYCAEDAVKMIDTTRAAGVMVGRPALGRPWVFSEMAAAMHGHPVPCPTPLSTAVEELCRHAQELVAWDADELSAIRQMRKFVPLYLHGFPSATELQGRLMRARSYSDYETSVDQRDWDATDVADCLSARHPRLKGGVHGSTHRVSLPPAWLDDTWSYTLSDLYSSACEG